MPKKSSSQLRSKDWSAQKMWIMGIVAALVVPLVVWVTGKIYSTTPPPDAERSAMIALANDIRSTPIMVRMIYQTQPDFEGQMWLKTDPRNTYWESIIFGQNLAIFSHSLGRDGVGEPFFYPREGKGMFKIDDIDKLKQGKKYEYRVQATPIGKGEDNPELDLTAIGIFSETPTIMPRKVLAHTDDLSLPTNVRTTLSTFIALPNVVSFSKAKSKHGNFLLVCAEISGNCDLGPRLNDTLPVYQFSGFRSTWEFITKLLTLTDAMDVWARHNSIDLGLLSIPAASVDAARKLPQR